MFVTAHFPPRSTSMALFPTVGVAQRLDCWRVQCFASVDADVAQPRHNAQRDSSHQSDDMVLTACGWNCARSGKNNQSLRRIAHPSVLSGSFSTCCCVEKRILAEETPDACKCMIANESNPTVCIGSSENLHHERITSIHSHSGKQTVSFQRPIIH